MLKKLFTILLLCGCASLSAADPSEQFLSAYQAYQQAEKSERDGNSAEALRKYRFAESILVEISSKDPAWQKAVIEYRLKRTRDGIARLQGGGDAVASAGEADLPRAPAPESAASGPSITVVPPGVGSGSQTLQQRTSPDSSSEVRRLKKQLESLKADLQEAKEALTSQKTRAKDLDTAKWVEERSMLEKELQAAKDQVAKLGEQLRKRDSWEKDLKDLQKKLNDAVADKAAAEDLYQQREKKMAEATAELTRQLEDARRKVVQGEGSQQKIQELSKEVENGRESLKQLRSKMEQTEASAKDALAKNTLLKEQLSDASQKLAASISAQEADKAALEEERQKLMAKLEQANLSLAELGKKAGTLDSFTRQVEQLQGQLAENGKALDLTKAKLAETEKSALEQKNESEKRITAFQKLKEMLEQQNSSLDGQLKGAVDRLKSVVEAGQDQSRPQEQFKMLQQQLEANVKSQEDARRQLASLTAERAEREKAIKEREKALADTKNEAEKLRADLSQANQRIVTLQQQTAQGEDRLKKLQDQLAEVSKGKAQGEKPQADLINELEKLRAELSESKQKFASMQVNASVIKDLETKLAEKESQIARLGRKEGIDPRALATDTSQENALLRGIVIRQVKEEARRAQARRLMEEEIKRLNIQSQSLTEQITVLAAPSINLTPEERALFKEGQLVIADDETGKLQASVAAPMGNANPADAPAPKQQEPQAQAQAKAGNAQSSPTNELSWQGKFKESIAKAKEAFDRQDFASAEGSFKEALTFAPDDYFALSNLGVVEFQLGKLKEAEEVLLKASQKSSDNSFALTTLGIVHYRQERLPDAEKVLRKAITINPQDFTAHNYLGIVLAATGKGSAGESEIMKALEINPQYADAHFNLAVIYATGKPPAKMMARKHYAKAVELGAPPDQSLERLVQ